MKKFISDYALKCSLNTLSSEFGNSSEKHNDYTGIEFRNSIAKNISKLCMNAIPWWIMMSWMVKCIDCKCECAMNHYLSVGWIAFFPPLECTSKNIAHVKHNKNII